MEPQSYPTGFYSIIDTDLLGDDALATTATILESGGKWIQLRAKSMSAAAMAALAGAMRELCDEFQAKLIVNDRVDVCMAAKAHGVHLGHTDLDPADARRLLGAPSIIGQSTHSPAQAREAESRGIVDYIGVGPVFPTPTKKDTQPPLGTSLLQLICTEVSLPVVAIGGIGLENCPSIRECGASAVAMISAVLSTTSVRESATRAVKLCR
jgi:thiamine-phosphate pyrophosphorylase